MSDTPKDQMAIAALFAALVETLDEKNDGFTRSFLRHLDEKQARLAGAAGHDLEPLHRVRAFLREDLDQGEPASVVYAKQWAPEEEQLPTRDKIQLPTLTEALQFWARLPTFDRERATIETASGHRLDFAAISAMSQRQRGRL